MKHGKRLERKHKRLLNKRGFDANKYFLEMEDNEKYVFINIDTKDLLVIFTIDMEAKGRPRINGKTGKLFTTEMNEHWIELLYSTEVQYYVAGDDQVAEEVARKYYLDNTRVEEEIEDI